MPSEPCACRGPASFDRQAVPLCIQGVFQRRVSVVVGDRVSRKQRGACKRGEVTGIGRRICLTSMLVSICLNA